LKSVKLRHICAFDGPRCHDTFLTRRKCDDEHGGSKTNF
jgi:hypothetical protein